ncbi:hypothetical protein ACI784_09175 [Geodermatophilus sp. SYSU D01186]
MTEPGDRVSATELPEVAASGVSEALREHLLGWLGAPIVGGIVVRPLHGRPARESPHPTPDTASDEE